MAITNRINGTNLLVYAAFSGGTDQAIAGSRSCSLSLTRASVDATCKDDDNWDVYMKSSRGWTVSCDGLYALSGLTTGKHAGCNVFDMIINDNTDFDQNLLLSFRNTSGTIKYYGYANLTEASISASDQDVTTFNCSFQGTGALTRSGQDQQLVN